MVELKIGDAADAEFIQSINAKTESKSGLEAINAARPGVSGVRELLRKLGLTETAHVGHYFTARPLADSLLLGILDGFLASGSTFTVRTVAVDGDTLVRINCGDSPSVEVCALPINDTP